MELHVLEESYAKAKAQRESLEKQLAEIDDELSKEREKWKELTQTIQKDELTKSLELEKKKDLLKYDDTSINAKHEQITSMEKEIEGIQIQISKNEDLQKCLKQQKDYIAKIEASENKLHRLEIRVNELEKVNDYLITKKEEEIKRKRELMEQIDKLKKDIEAKDQLTNLKIQKELNERKSKEVIELQNTLSKIEANIKEVQGRIVEENEKIKTFSLEKITLSVEYELSKKKLSQINAEIDQTNASIESMKSSKAQLTQSLEEKNAKLEEMSSKCALAEMDNKSLKEDNINLKSKLENISKSVYTIHLASRN